MAPWTSLISLLRSNTNGDIVGDEMSALDIPVGTPCASCKEAGHSTCMAGVDDGGVFLCYACDAGVSCEYEKTVVSAGITIPGTQVKITASPFRASSPSAAKEEQKKIARECHEKGMTKREARKLSGLSEPTVRKIYREEQEKAAGYKAHDGPRSENPHAPKVGDVWMADEKKFGPSKIDAVGNLRFDANAVSLDEAPAIMVEEREVAIEELIARCVSEGPRARAINPQSAGEAYAQTAFEGEKRIAEAIDLPPAHEPKASDIRFDSAPRNNETNLYDHYAAVIADLNLRIEALSDFRDLAIDLQRGL